MSQILRPDLSCRIVAGAPAWPPWKILAHTVGERLYDAFLIAVIVVAVRLVLR